MSTVKIRTTMEQYVLTRLSKDVLRLFDPWSNFEHVQKLSRMDKYYYIWLRVQNGRLQTSTDCHELCLIVSVASGAFNPWMCDLGIRIWSDVAFCSVWSGYSQASYFSGFCRFSGFQILNFTWFHAHFVLVLAWKTWSKKQIKSTNLSCLFHASL